MSRLSGAYLPLAGGVMTGSLIMANNVPIKGKTNVGDVFELAKVDNANQVVLGDPNLVGFLKSAGLGSLPWANLPFTKGYTSTDTAITLGGTSTFTHNLGAGPLLVGIDLVCIANDLGFVAGEILQYAAWGSNDNGGLPSGVGIRKDATNVLVTWNNQHITVIPPSGSGNNITPASWNFRVHVVSGGTY